MSLLSLKRSMSARNENFMSPANHTEGDIKDDKDNEVGVSFCPPSCRGCWDGEPPSLLT